MNAVEYIIILLISILDCVFNQYPFTIFAYVLAKTLY